MTKTNRETTLKAAREHVRIELSDVLRQIEALNRRATILQQTLNGMNGVIDNQEDNVSEREKISDLGLTEAIRRVFRASVGLELMAQQIRDELVRRNFDLTKYTQPMVPIHNTLKRLESQREIKSSKYEGLRTAYTWLAHPLQQT